MCTKGEDIITLQTNQSTRSAKDLTQLGHFAKRLSNKINMATKKLIMLIVTGANDST